MPEELTKQDLKLREKQGKCQHPSFKCSLCKLYQDNLHDHQQQRIFLLEQTVAYLEKELYNSTHGRN